MLLILNNMDDFRGALSEALYWMRHLSWGMSRGGLWAGGMLQVGGRTDLMLTFHIDWLLSLDESILTTDKYLNSEFLVIETQIMETGLTVHSWDFMAVHKLQLKQHRKTISGTEDEVENPLRMVMTGQISSLVSSVMITFSSRNTQNP